MILSAGASVAADHVSLRATDGTALSATLYTPTRLPAPAVILVHMLARSSADWAATAEPLQQSGLLVLAIDLRGHGASSESGIPSGDLTVLERDVAAAVAFVRQRRDLCNGRIGIAGASIGANLAVIVAASEPAVQSLALLSPSGDYRGVRCDAAMKRYGDRPVLLVASTNDPYALRTSKQFAAAAPRAELITPEDAGHGTLMLARQPELVNRLVDWFRNTLL
jgi:alpha-beta hydrolase superfamily lysophospholipase